MDLAPNEIHLWVIAIDKFHSSFDEFYQLLNEREKQRTNRFLFEKDKIQYAISEALLRKILSKYTNVAPELITFARASRGKPYLSLEQNSSNIKFNMTHSKNMTVIAVTTNDEIGVDVESSERIINITNLAEDIFSKIEIEWLNQATAQEIKNCFLYLWTRKESILKQTGEGLYSDKLTQYTTTPFEMENMLLESFGYIQSVDDEVSIVSFSPDVSARDFKTLQETYYVTVCYEGLKKQVKVFDFRDI